MNWYSTDNRSLHVPLSDIPEVAYAEFHDELAARGEGISDFPICNKSFNLSYCGHDL